MKAIRHGRDRIGESGIVCFVNNSFATEKSFGGMRKELAKDRDLNCVLDLSGNLRKHPKLPGTTHNIFDIQVGAGISLFVRFQKSRLNSRRRFFRASNLSNPLAIRPALPTLVNQQSRQSSH